MPQEIALIVLALLIPFTMFKLLENRQQQERKMREKPLLDPSWISPILSLVETKSITIDNFCKDYQIERSDFQKFISCEKIEPGQFFYICGLLDLDWKKVQKQR